MLNMRSVDLNLLPVFEAAYEERSLSRAALRLAITQSAVSHALARLRVLFKDQLFVRHARGVTPTPTADAVYEKTRPALGLVREAVTQTRGFDPASSERQFFVAIPHPLGPMIAVRLLEQLRDERTRRSRWLQHAVATRGPRAGPARGAGRCRDRLAARGG